MLELNNIVKIYPSGGENIMALKGVNLRFRNNEFVSILGPSGCGKTTTLNIIGGLDQYTDGDLIINGRSTKEYKDRDWDTYRNHSIGFVFQSYNLIPHQTVLSNVELALTLSGVSKKERRERAKQALEAVGLGNHLRKRPAQMSGGQMQRVAIARAIVNDPDIILADEPTGALDSETSIQVMNILKEIAQDRLVVMVTHNPELAMEYSTRIVRMLDGNVISDSMPITEAELEALREEDAAVEAAGGRKAYAAAAAAAGDTAEGVSSAEAGTSAVPAAPIGRRKKKASMSLLTSFSLSLNNLFTKKGRTLLTAFAGSIGIIGIALIYAVSQGTNDYIDTVQEDTLSSYPLSITSEAADITGILGSFVSKREEVEALKSDGTVVEQAMLSTMLEGVGTNDLHSLKVYLEENSDAYAADVTNITYGYNITPRVYTRDCMGELLAVNPSRIMRSMGMNNFGMSIFSEMSNLSEKTISQYEMLQGSWPQEWNELILVLNDPNRISDLVTFAFGLHDPNELREMFEAVMNGKTPEASSTPPLVFTYDDLMAMDLRLVPMGDMYRRDEEHNVWENMSDDSDFMAGAFEGGEKLVITGIVTPIDDASGVLLSTGLNYLPSLPLHVMELASEHKIVKQQQADEDINVFSGKPFGEEDSESGIKFEDMITFDASAFSRAFNINFDPNSITPMLTEYLQNYAKNMNTDNSGTAKAFTDGFRQLATGMLNELVSKGGGTATVRLAETTGIVNTYLAGAEAKGIIQGLVNSYGLTADNYLTVYRPLLTNMLNNYILAHNEDLGPGEDPEEPDEPEEPVDPEDPDAPGEDTGDPAPGPSEEGGSSGSEPGEGGSGEGSDTPSTDSGTTPGGDSTGDGSSSGDSAGGSDSGSTSGSDSSSTSGGSSSGSDSGTASGGSSSGGDTGSTPPAPAPDPAPETTALHISGGSTMLFAPATSRRMLGEPEVPGGPSVSPDDAADAAMRSGARFTAADVPGIVNDYASSALVTAASNAMGSAMLNPGLRSELNKAAKEFVGMLMRKVMGSMSVNQQALSEAFQFNMTEADMTRLMTALSGGSTNANSAEDNLRTLGYGHPDYPQSINVYLKDFEGKDRFKLFLDDYNDQMEAQGEEEKIIQYTDITGILMSSVTTIINAVTYVLIAFVGISLVVSSIMIGVITLISVQERTKEIGILRAIGASKRNVSSMFNAETVIIGFTSGVIGVGVTYLLCIPINIILHKLTGISYLSAKLPVTVAVILVLISMFMTLIAGIIPSRSASKKDPVIALRSE